jgi:hypothetical protein
MRVVCAARLGKRSCGNPAPVIRHQIQWIYASSTDQSSPSNHPQPEVERKCLRSLQISNCNPHMVEASDLHKSISATALIALFMDRFQACPRNPVQSIIHSAPIAYTYDRTAGFRQS